MWNGYFSAPKRLVSEISRLARKEVGLARAELHAKARNAAVGVALLMFALLAAPIVIATLMAAAVLALSLVLPSWAAALVVAFTLLVAVAVAIGAGKRLLRSSLPPVPRKAIKSTREDLRSLLRRPKTEPK